MSNQYELTTLTFVGSDFDDHGLELGFLSDLAAYKQLVVETTKSLWRAEHPDRERLPRGFEEGIKLKFFEIQPGSTVLAIQRVFEVEDGDTVNMAFPEGDPVNDAAILLEEAIEAVSEERVLPDRFPPNVIPFFDAFGKSLRDDARIELRSPRRTVRSVYTPQTRQRLTEWSDRYYEDRVDITGEVRLADLEGCNFLLRLDAATKATGKFAPEQEAVVTEALYEHTSRRLRVIGVGRFDQATGRLDRLVRVDSLEFAPSETPAYDVNAGSVWDQILDIGNAIPDDARSSLPTDLAANVEEYLDQ